MRRKLLILLCILTFGGPSCGGVVGPSQNQIEEFAGAVEPLGEGEQHEFQVSRNGEFEIRLSALQPSAGVILQVLLARFAGGFCDQVVGVNFAQLNAIALTGAITTGRYCVVVYDEGFITERVTYTLRVSHP
jgi:hypothetical protein